MIALTIETVGDEWRELGEKFPERSDPSVQGGQEERKRARNSVGHIVLTLREIDMAASDGDYAAATQAFADYRQKVALAQNPLLAAEQWSLFNPTVRKAHFDALQQLSDLAR